MKEAREKNDNIPFSLIEEVKRKNPLVHNITNIVVANDSANGLLAVGASPFMSSTIEELEEVVAIADVVVLNMGTLNDEQLDAMLIAGTKANQLNKPVVLDPVGAGATTYRKKAVLRLLEQVHPTLIRGNAGEIAALADEKWHAKGVDAGTGSGNVRLMAEKLATQQQTFVFVSGEIDTITDGTTSYYIKNGTSYFTKMTGAGCLNSCICGAFLSVDEKRSLESIVVGSTMYALAGELVANELSSLAVGSFRTLLLDKLSKLTSIEVLRKAMIEKERN